MPVSVTRGCLAVSILLLLWSAPAAPGQAVPAPDAEEARARALMEAKLTFPTYVLDGEQFPACEFEQPARVKELVGPYSFKTIFYDRDYRPVENARAPGPYGAVVEMTSESGQTLRRYAMLFRTAEKVEPGWHRRADAPPELARRMGLAAGAVRRETAAIAETLKDRPFAEFARDPRAARLFAGLSLDRAGNAPAQKSDDAFARERQWWVDLKRHLNGMDQK